MLFLSVFTKKPDMKKIVFLCVALGLSVASFSQTNTNAVYNRFFTGSTMRVDYYHTGTAREEHFSMDRVLNDGPWAGSETVLLDNLNRCLLYTSRCV